MENKLGDRVQREADVFDQKTLRRDTLQHILRHADTGPAKSRRISFIRKIVQRHGQGNVLEIGSEAWAPLIFHNGVTPESLTCINISKTAAKDGEAQARSENLDYKFLVMDAHKLEFEDNSMDLVYGQAIVHHLDIEIFMREIHRVLKPDGKMLFVEPLGYNPVAGLVRLLTPQARTDDEKPLAYGEFRIMRKYFEIERYCTELFYVPAAICSGVLFKEADNIFLRAADKLDQGIAKYFPAVGLLCRTVTIFGEKRRSVRR